MGMFDRRHAQKRRLHPPVFKNGGWEQAGSRYETRGGDTVQTGQDFHDR